MKTLVHNIWLQSEAIVIIEKGDKSPIFLGSVYLRKYKASNNGVKTIIEWFSKSLGSKDILVTNPEHQALESLWQSLD